ncbi:unnamed protein product [Clavelina lepadiformis]|uniref:Uncharacterized protein n=1 Tax=Clavelina lepadiformis TaxID=159417 RepID=A0ABP0FM28_CLALP
MPAKSLFICILFSIWFHACKLQQQDAACTSYAIITEDSGNISSPNYPNDYSNNLNCNWTILAPPNKLIEVEFVDFHLQSCSFSLKDYLNIHDGEEQYAGISFCGTNKPVDFESSTNRVNLFFSSDSSTNEKGFLIKWTFKDACSNSEFRCWNGSCILSEKKCDGVRHCEDDSDEIECANTNATFEECGKQSVAPDFTWNQRIIGGNEARNGSWPWQAMLVYSFSGSSFCGASIIDQRFILTAAHCVEFLSGPSDLKVFVGRHSYQNYGEGKLLSVVNIFPHPDYNQFNLQNDIALLELQEAISFATNIRKVCYPPVNDSSIDPDAGTTCIITGWGNISPSGGSFIPPETLYQARVPVVGSEKCRDLYSSSHQVTESQICAGFVNEGGVDTCQGDSGGPLICLVGENTWYQVGLTSFGIGCAQPGYPGVYTRLSYFSQWINEVVTSNGSYVNGVYTEEPACVEPTNITEQNGTISSPNYPSNYANNLNCTWIIQAPANKLIEIRFLDFQLEGCSYTVYDFLAVYDGNELYTGVQLCGSNKPKDFESSTNQVRIHLYTDYVVTTKGFLLAWNFTDTCSNDEFRCWNGSCIPFEQKCDGVRHCTDDSDEIECVLTSATLEECGKQSIAPDFTWNQRIIGGNEARNGSWPWQVMVVAGSSFCGGSIIDERFVLTAAHCVNNIFLPSSLEVYVGRHSFDNNGEGKLLVAKNIIVHPAYNLSNLQNDIALLELEDAISFGTNIRKICYPSANDSSIDPDAGTICITTGWGNVSPSGGPFIAPETLFQARVPIVDLDRCNVSYSSSIHVLDSHICVGYFDDGGVGPCHGDSGGPLICLVNENTWYQVGITSFGIGCAQPGYPGVYTRLSYFSQWIDEVIASNGSYGVDINKLACVEPTIITEWNGTISSPNYPSNYANNLNCTWIIQAPANKLIKVRFLDFELQGCSYTVNDYLAVYDGNILYTGVEFCGSNKPKDFESSTNQVTINFISNDIISRKGFHFNWTFVDACLNTEFRCWNGNCIPVKEKCDGVRHCEDDSDEIECANTNATFEECGKQSIAPDFTWNQRIIGGNEARNGSWPWQAMLVYSFGGSSFCGASIIDQRFILTAAHCVEFLSGPSDLKVYVGRHSYQNYGEGKLLSVENIFLHPDYNQFNLQNDIALLELQEAISFATNIRKICYPPVNDSSIDPDAGTTCIITGWGNISPSGGSFIPPETLYQARVPIVGLEKCRDLYSSLNQATESQICAGFVNEGGVDTCQGDSGGPLICLVGENTWYQVGITSFGIGCAQPGYPGVYTRLSYFSQWINEVVTSNGSYVNGVYTEEPACVEPTNITEQNGTISSPNYPSNYANNLNCTWIIQAPSNKLIEIRFLDFQLEGCSYTVYDFLAVYDGNELYTGVQLCGSNKPKDFESSTNQVRIHLYTDYVVTTKGFLLAWNFTDTCSNDEFRCWNGSCIPFEQKCDGVRHCEDDSDEIECVLTSATLEECGKQSIAPDFTWNQRIIGGNEARNGSWPWQAMLVDSFSGSSFCGASIIDQRFILTAAHCVEFLSGPSNLKVYVGRHSYQNYGEGKLLSVENIFLHPDYNQFNLQNDIALLELQEAISFATNIRKVCYPPVNDSSIDPDAGTTCIITGWGNISPSGGSFIPPETLYQARVPVVGSEKCRDLYSSSHQVTESQICAGFVNEGGVDTCQGDSGGPLFCLVGENTWYQVGITSFGIGCAQPGYPGVYTRLSYFSQWINEVVTSNGSYVNGVYTEEPACVEPTKITEQNGTISSPNYPSNYANNLNCTWIIQAPANKLIEIRFLDFQLEGCSYTVYDFLAIYDGNELYTGVQLCGSNKPKDFESSTNQVKIHLYTDYVVTTKGFLLAWTFTDTCSNDEFRCWNGSCIPFEQKCDGVRHCEDDSDEIECVLTSATLEECGKQSIAPDFTWNQRIIGGNEARNGSWPWQVMVVAGSSFCGGSIIDERFVLTAAHCVNNLFLPSSLEVYVGRHSFDNNGEGKLLVVKNIIVHPAYNPSNLQNDIALLELEDAISFGTNIRKICYPSANDSSIDPDAGTICITTGWGNVSPSGGPFIAPETLFQARVPIVDLDRCNVSYSSSIHVLDSHICVGYFDDGGVGPCHGDSGGPLICLVNENTWYQVGITSFGIGCAQPGYPGVYTRLSYFSQWIDEVIASNGSYGVDINKLACVEPTIITEWNGTISSPNYPSNYANNLNCTWIIQAPANKLIKFCKQGSLFSSYNVFSNLLNDIALLELEDAISFATNIRKICYPPTNDSWIDPDADTTCIITGWGNICE